MYVGAGCDGAEQRAAVDRMAGAAALFRERQCHRYRDDADVAAGTDVIVIEHVAKAAVDERGR